MITIFEKELDSKVEITKLPKEEVAFRLCNIHVDATLYIFDLFSGMLKDWSDAYYKAHEEAIKILIPIAEDIYSAYAKSQFPDVGLKLKPWRDLSDIDYPVTQITESTDEDLREIRMRRVGGFPFATKEEEE